MKFEDLFKIHVSEHVPPGELWFITPGEEIRVVGPEGNELKHVTVREPRVDRIINIGQ